MTLSLIPVTLAEANKFVTTHHRHLKKVVGHKFSVGCCNENNELLGVTIVGRPIARILQDGFTLEITRLCSTGEKNVCSKLYRAAWNVAKNLGYRRLITYIRNDEKGISLKAAGFRLVAKTNSHQWGCKSRPRLNNEVIDKLRFKITN